MPEEMKHTFPADDDQHSAAGADARDAGMTAENDAMEDEPWMNADDYHNSGRIRAAFGAFQQALEVCQEGLEHWPGNADLLADVVRYAGMTGQIHVADEHVRRLRAIPCQEWPENAFESVIEYLLTNPKANAVLCRTLVDAFITYHPHNEMAYLEKAALEESLGNDQRAMEVLQETLERIPNAQQCARQLADMQMERGLYADVIKTCDDGQATSGSPRPSDDMLHLLLLRTLARDELLHQAGKVGADEIDAVDQAYADLEAMYPRFIRRYGDTVSTRRKMLKNMRASLRG